MFDLDFHNSMKLAESDVNCRLDTRAVQEHDPTRFLSEIVQDEKRFTIRHIQHQPFAC